jgi:hypothetical protein
LLVGCQIKYRTSLLDSKTPTNTMTAAKTQRFSPSCNQPNQSPP